MNQAVRMSALALAGFALGCGDSNPAPKVAVERKLVVVDPAENKKATDAMMEQMKKMNGGAKAGTATPGGS